MKHKLLSPLTKRLIIFQLILLFIAISISIFVSNNMFKDAFISHSFKQSKKTLQVLGKIFTESYGDSKKICALYEDKFEDKRVTVIQADGSVICDSVAQTINMDNHREREEIVNARKNKKGKAVRYSNTLKMNMLYTALRVESNEQNYYIRESISLAELDGYISSIKKSVFLILIPIFALLSTLSILINVKRDAKEKANLDKVKEGLIANISHEVRTPLAALQGHTQLLTSEKDKLPSELLSSLEKIDSNCRRLTLLFKDILELSRLENNAELFIEVLLTRELTTTITESVAHNYKNKNVNINTDIQAEKFDGDPQVIEQLVSNLIDNAYKYTSDGGEIEITWKTVGKMIQLSVRDNGIGIKSKDLDKIFQRFFRVEASRSRSLGGTGLGLAIVKHATNQHGGNIWVESIPGSGSTFYVQLPLAQRES